MFDWIFSYFVGAKPPTYTSDDYSKLLFPEVVKNDDEEEVLQDELVLASKCQHKVGKITLLEPNYGLIDGKYYFELEDVKQKNIKVGQPVRYVAYHINENVEWKIKQVSIIEPDEWQNEQSDTSASAITSEYVVVKKTLTARIISRRGRILTMDPGEIICDLDRIESDFLPIEGDWVSLSAIVELREDRNRTVDNVVDIERLKPLRSRLYQGRVSHLSQIDGKDVGIINSEVYFTSNVYEAGCKPSVNDRVIARVIESEQGALIWRALNVIIVDSVSSTKGTLLSQIEEERLFDSKNGVTITSSCDKMTLKIGEQTTFKIIVENAGHEAQELKKIVLKNSEYSGVMKVAKEMKESVKIPSEGSYELQVNATASCSGYYSEIVILHFEGDWKMGCMLDIYVHIEDEFRHCLKSKTAVNENVNESIKNADIYNNGNSNNRRRPYDARRMAAKQKLLPTKIGFIVPGVRPVRPTAFLPRVLEHYPIPQSIQKIVIGDNVNYRRDDEITVELEDSFHYLTEELKSSNYLNKLHTLLHLEDLELLICIKKYDKERVSFDKRGEYLVLEIPNLVESRPSLVVGDKLIATELAANGTQDRIRFEGYIHKVTHDSIKLKFNDAFHSKYDGKSMSVTFQHSRTSIRRCHQALNEIFRHMGTAFLFPNALGAVKPPQVNVVGEYPSKNISDKEHICKADKTEVKAGKDDLSPSSQKQFLQTNTSLNLEDSDKENLPSEVEKMRKVSEEEHSYAVLSRQNVGNEKNLKIMWEEENQRKKNNDQNAVPAPKPKKTSNIPRTDVIVKWVNPILNKYQREAVKNILKGEARPLPYIIHGPPGTGKTITVVETILQISFLMPESRILVATPSNSSADLVCERLLNWNLLKAGDLVRLVGYNFMIENRMSPTIKPYCTCIDTKSTDKSVSQISYDEDGVKYSSREVIGRHRITVGTCVSVGSLYMMGFPKNHFTHIIIDEAGQATEPEIMIPLAFLNEDGQAILAGDPRQLGPVITSRIANTMGLGESLLSRLDMRFPYHRDPEGYPETNGYDPRLVTRLLYNYRSLPNILELYSSLFYRNELLPQVCDKCSPEAELMKRINQSLKESSWHKVNGVIFYGVKGIDLQDEDSPSWYNDHEIARVLYYVSALYGEGLKSTDIGIVTPYQKQVTKLREMLRNCDLDLPKIGTVEEFQGQERNVIIISTVRSNDRMLDRDLRHSLGFVSSQQRMNVAISRARALLIIVGNPHVLSLDATWKQLIKKCHARGYYVGCDLPRYF